ncbi:CTP synthetase [Actibacterium sp. MT2.3-13A]|uniref:CTP synthetase n=1 Tax=Actibacterium sp. MT2.3-13A TaxID=2828332 RepID=UPI001BA9A335|nr:CTP synthetase [Actibacterium sp. MT2.3-13A]
MLRLAMLLYSLISATLAGSAIVAVRVAGFDTLAPILAAALGAVLAVPVTWGVARALCGRG